MPNATFAKNGPKRGKKSGFAISGGSTFVLGALRAFFRHSGQKRRQNTQFALEIWFFRSQNMALFAYKPRARTTDSQAAFW
jgi:hypothetical protein